MQERMNMKTKIVYEDGSVLVLYKPAGLATQTARVGQSDVVSELRKYLSQGSARSQGENGAIGENGRAGASRRAPARQGTLPYVGVVHRLDQPVEGLLVFAKTKADAARLSAQLEQGALNKRYHAVVCGNPAADAATLTDYLLRDAEDRVARIVEEAGTDRAGEIVGEAGADRAGRIAVLHYRVVGRRKEPFDMALLEVRIDTGRFHQIRAQLAHAGLPILGDRKYGGAQLPDASDATVASDTASLLVNPFQGGIALCASQVSFRHPRTGKSMSFEVSPQTPPFGLFPGFPT